MPVFNEEFNLYDQNNNSELFHLHSFGKLFPDSSYIISRKENNNTIIECVLDGTGYFEHNGIVTMLEKGDCYIIKPGGAHTYYSDDKNPYTKIWFTVSGKMVDEWLKFYKIDTPIFVRQLDITPYYNQIKQIGLGKPNFQNEKRLMLLTHNVLFEMGMTAPKTNKQQKSEAHYIKTNDNVILDVKKYIEKQCNEQLRMKDIAIKFGISPNIMNKMFIEKYGISPNKYHMQCKLQSSVYFLESTDLSIDMISETVGFCDRSHFRKAFVKEYSVTPSRYRKEFLKSQAKT
ncbi:AraC family transcriptional regulator [uncultured Eubacterium sp.]|uniref:AraC family transcriptional regulator n=1 Tax=uncultured Eubacterium sp. TaxID=165185 RepID=UPI002601CD1C|nr:AraC family transcriptional regulator [uncultured Eubacterium sp.]